LGTEVETVRIGKKPFHTDFTVHRNLLRRIPYFDSPLTIDPEGFGLLKHHALTEEKATAFTIYVQWLYTGRIHTRMQNQTQDDTSHRDEWFELTNAYILGEHLVDVDFCDRLMDAFVSWHKEASPDGTTVILDNVAYIYRMCPETSPLRKLVSDITAFSFDSREIQRVTIGNEDRFPYDFVTMTLRNLAEYMRYTRLFGAKTNPVDESSTTCNYHSHGEMSCYRASN
jgi:hypothetical protein